MIAYRLGADSVTVLRAATTLPPDNPYGARERDWSGATETVVTGVSVQPVSTAEATVDREWAASHLVMYAPADIDVQATDRVLWRGTTYEVDGPPRVWVDDAGITDHVEASLKLMTG